jgi:tetratricopeptide (TPR) repeat protein
MRFVSVMVLVQIMSWVPVAHAAANEESAKAEADKDAARTEWLRGNAAYDIGRYEEAATHYEAAYLLVQNPAVLFNIAQSYRMGGKLTQALDRYRSFLRKASADAPNRATAEKFVEEIKRKLEEKKEAAPVAPIEAAPATQPTLPAPTTTPPPPADTTPPTAGSSSAPPPPAGPVATPVPPPVDTTANLTSPPVTPEPASAEQPIYKKWWFWTGVGAVVVAGTVTAIMLTRQSSNPCGVTSLTCWEIK